VFNAISFVYHVAFQKRCKNLLILAASQSWPVDFHSVRNR